MTSSNEFDLPDVPRASAVSKTINRAFDYPLPERIAESFDALAALNPEYTHRVFTSDMMDAYVHKHFPGRVHAAYSRIRLTYKAARADLFRYLLIYNEGGIYLDVKSTASQPFRQIVSEDDQCILSHWDNGPGQQYASFGLHPELADTTAGEFQNWFLIYARGHPFLRATIERVVSNIEGYRPWREGVARPGTIRVTGPIAYTLAIEPMLKQESFRVGTNSELGLVYTIYDHFLEHTRHTTSHYHWNRASVVRPKGLQVFSFAAFQAWSKLLESPRTAPLMARLGFSRPSPSI